MKKLFYLFLAISILSCNNSGEHAQNADTLSHIPSKKDNLPAIRNDINGCYISVSGRDTFVASLQETNNQVSGKLSFDNFEKDASSGKVSGTREGDVIKLVYSFQSEGMNSVMDVWFQVTDGRLVRGIGEIQTKGDTAYFADPSSITYTGSVFEKTSCDDLDDKYK
jgi:hypothetical protein